MPEGTKTFLCMINFFLIISVVFIPVDTYSNGKDSIAVHLQSLSNDTNSDDRAEVYTSICIHLANKNLVKSALSWIDSAICLTSDSVKISRNLRVKAQLLVKLERFEEAEMAIQRALEFALQKLPNRERVILYNLLGSIYAYTGRYEDGFMLYYQALGVSQKTGDSEGVCMSTANLGVIYYKILDYNMAVTCFERHRSSCSDAFSYDGMYPNLALAYSFAGNQEKALYYLKASENQARTLGRLQMINRNYAYGVIFEHLQMLDSAQFFFKRSLSDALKESNVRFQAENLLKLGEIYFQKRNLKQSGRCLRIAENIANQNMFEDILIKIYRQEIVLARKFEDLSKLTAYQGRYIAKSKKLYSLIFARIIGRTKSMYYEKQYIDGIVYHKDLLRKQQKLARAEMRLRLIIFSISILMAGVLILLFISFRTKMLHRKKLQQAISKRNASSQERAEKLKMVLTTKSVYLTKYQEIVHSFNYEIFLSLQNACTNHEQQSKGF